MTWNRGSLLRALSVLFFIPLQVAAIRDAHELFVGILAIIAAVHLCGAWLDGASKGLLVVWASGCLILICALVAMWLGVELAYSVSFMPPLLLYGFLACYFGRSLLPGQEPIITRFRRIEAGQVSGSWPNYTRRLTAVWTVLFILLLIWSAALPFVASLATWTFFAVFGAPAIMLGLFFGEHAYRAVIHGKEGRAHPVRTLRILSDPRAWIHTSANQPVGRTNRS